MGQGLGIYKVDKGNSGLQRAGWSWGDSGDRTSVGHSLWQAGADLRKVSNRISVPAALQAPLAGR